ncbi:hypothetical protein LTR50_007083 [Elasticomyces elasticus]|nr:hypothetical protein LTR50_007083 [Elasticomyces elasticus]
MAENASYFEIPKTCKAGCVIDEGPNFRVEVQDVPVPEPGPNQVLLRLNATGICYSDLHYMLNDLGFGPMSQFGVRSAGHEGAGVVVKVGSNVTTWKHETYCEKGLQTGFQVAGTYQQYILSPANYTTRIPDGVDDFYAGPIMCSGSTIYRSLMESRLKAGDWAVFPGAGGGVGHMGVQLAKAIGLRVIGVDGGDEKRELCVRLGCDAFVDFTKVNDVAAEVMKITGHGAQGVFVTAGNAAAYASAPGMLGVGGKLMCIGLPPAGSCIVGAHPAEFVLKNLHVIGTKVGSMKDTDAAMDFAARGLLKPIYEKFPLKDLPAAVDKLRAGKVAGRCVVDFNS